MNPFFEIFLNFFKNTLFKFLTKRESEQKSIQQPHKSGITSDSTSMNMAALNLIRELFFQIKTRLYTDIDQFCHFAQLVHVHQTADNV